MKYLVTGAAGFIGAAVAERLLREGNECTTIDNLSTGKKEHIPDGCRFIMGDVANAEVINKLNDERFDAIIHISGQSSGEVSFENPVYDLQTNTQSTVLLMKYAQRTGCDKFIYASSMSVYGDHTPPVCTENTKLVPKSFYAVGKIASENYMRIFSEQYGMDCTALRFFNVYGAGQNMDNFKQGMASIYLAMAIKNKKITVKGSKDRFRDFVYIDDVVDAVCKSLQRGKGYNVYNVCTGVPTTVEEVIEAIKRGMNEEIKVEYVNGTPGDQFGIYGTNDRIYKDLNWRFHDSFEKGMEKMIKWALKQEADNRR